MTAVVVVAVAVAVVYASKERDLTIVVVPRGILAFDHVDTSFAPIEPIQLASGAFPIAFGSLRALGCDVARLATLEARLLLPRPLWVWALTRKVSALTAVDANWAVSPWFVSTLGHGQDFFKTSQYIPARGCRRATLCWALLSDLMDWQAPSVREDPGALRDNVIAELRVRCHRRCGVPEHVLPHFSGEHVKQLGLHDGLCGAIPSCGHIVLDQLLVAHCPGRDVCQGLNRR